MKKIILILCLALVPNLSFGETVLASWYQHGKITANGERFDPNGFTVAHRTLPFGTFVILTRNNVSAVARVNDRGPFIHGRSIDLSRRVAEHLGCIDIGICTINMIAIQPLLVDIFAILR